MEQKLGTKGIFVGSLITSSLGGVLLLLEDFAGWYNYGSLVESWGWVGFIASFEILDILGMAIFLVFIGALVACALISVVGLMNEGNVTREMILLGLLLAAVTTAVAMIGGLIFVVDMLLDEPTNWWLGSGFYAGVLGGGLTAVLFYLIYREKMNKEG